MATSNVHPFLRFEILKFQLHSNKQIVDLNKLETKIEIKDKNQSNETRIKKPIFNETTQSIRFDAGIFANIEREIFIRITYNETLFQFQSDLKYLEKIADGFRHQITFQPKAHAELIIEYKGIS